MSLTASVWVVLAVTFLLMSFKRPVWALGLYFLTFAHPSAPSTTASTLGGDLLTLGCAAAYAIHITLIEKLAPGRSSGWRASIRPGRGRGPRRR